MSNNNNRKVLVVDNEELSRSAAQVYLERLGCSVDIAPTGEEAIRLVQKNIYDLVLMDLGLFDMDGLNVAKRIREMGDQIKEMPLIAVTRYTLKSLRKRAKELGFRDYIIKPLNLELCKEILDKLLVWE